MAKKVMQAPKPAVVAAPPAERQPSGLWCVTCEQPIYAGEQCLRVGAGNYAHVKCPVPEVVNTERLSNAKGAAAQRVAALNAAKENTMATPVKPAPKPAAVAAKPAAPAKPAPVAKAAPSPKPAAAPAKPVAAAKAAAPAKPAPKAAAPAAKPVAAPAKAAPKVAKPAPVAAPAPAPEAVVEKPKKERKPAVGFSDIKVEDYALNTIIIRSVNEDGTVRNPKRPGSAPAARFDLYGVGGITVQDALQAGVTEADIRWDLAHEYIELQ